MSGNRTEQAVVRQVEAMGCERYEIGIRDPKEGRMMSRVWDREQLQRGLAWLRYMNRENDIYIRPAESSGLVLLDDLSSEAVRRLKEDGLPPAAIVETSPGNFQVWLRLSPEALPPEEASGIARILARRYNADISSADFRHYGRLAGFTNRKPKHQRPDGQQPYVLLQEASGAGAFGAVHALLAAAAGERKAAATVQAVPTVQGRQGGALPDPANNYARRAEPIMARYPDTDFSRLDWMVAKELAMSSLTVDQQYLEQALLQGSPQLSERKVGHVEAYVRRTAEKVLQDPEVVAARERRAERERARAL